MGWWLDHGERRPDSSPVPTFNELDREWGWDRRNENVPPSVLRQMPEVQTDPVR